MADEKKKPIKTKRKPKATQGKVSVSLILSDTDKENTNNGKGQGAKRADGEYNHQVIRQAYVDLIKKLKRRPSFAEVAAYTDLSVPTIARHIKDLKFEPLKHPLRVLTDDILLSVANEARKGKYWHSRLWFQLAEGWSEDVNVNLGAQETLADVIAGIVGIKTKSNGKSTSTTDTEDSE